MMTKHELEERLEELNQDFDNAVRDGNNALANQIDMEINYLMENNNEED